MLLQISSYSLLFNLICLKLTIEKVFLVRKDTEKINNNQHSYHVMEHSKGQGYDYQDDIYPSYEDAPDIATEDISDDIYISYEVSRPFSFFFSFLY